MPAISVRAAGDVHPECSSLEEEIAGLVDEPNWLLPGLGLKRQDDDRRSTAAPGARKHGSSSRPTETSMSLALAFGIIIAPLVGEGQQTRLHHVGVLSVVPGCNPLDYLLEKRMSELG